MQDLLRNIQIRVNEHIYLKDPESSEIGRKMLNESIGMIHELGIEAFTFKKLATALGTTESTIYRYFENKHNLLVYLLAWYWGWLEYEIVLITMNIEDPAERLQKTIESISDPLKGQLRHDLIDLKLLYEIVIAESPKSFLTKEVDVENEIGFFVNYKRICERIVKNIEEIDSSYPFARTLALTIVQCANQHRFFAMHFPNLTEISPQGTGTGTAVFLTDLVLKSLQNNK
ncbi:MAG: TetR/AcrR family transcriptional regulator [Cyclobacteriaceae bacterium]|nr:TetR/AcrR family transcriptional regulator [Cyclobacteriaceae bacterium]